MISRALAIVVARPVIEIELNRHRAPPVEQV